jgi:hypothetical protein
MAYDACETSPTRPPHHIRDIEVTGSPAGPNVLSDPRCEEGFHGNSAQAATDGGQELNDAGSLG